MACASFTAHARLQNEFLSSFKLAIPAGLDIIATSLMNVGLLTVAASINQVRCAYRLCISCTICNACMKHLRIQQWLAQELHMQCACRARKMYVRAAQYKDS